MITERQKRQLKIPTQTLNPPSEKHHQLLQMYLVITLRAKYPLTLSGAALRDQKSTRSFTLQAAAQHSNRINETCPGSQALHLEMLDTAGHKITEWLRWERTSGNHLVQPLIKQCHPEQAAQDHIQLVFEDLQGGRLQNLPG